LDVVALPDNQEAEIFLTTTGDQATAGAMAEFRLSVGYDVNEMILRTNTYSEGIVDTYGDDIRTDDLGGALAPSTIHVTRSADTTFDWELTGSLTGSGSMDWADAAGIDLFFGMGGYSGGEYASQMDNLAIDSAAPRWRDDFTGDWTTANWTRDGGTTYVAPATGGERF